VEWIKLADNGDQCPDFGNTIMNIRVSRRTDISLLAEQLPASQN
jgi:hypothetical protein